MKQQERMKKFDRELDDAIVSMEKAVETEFANAGRRVGQAIAKDIEAHRSDVREHGWSASPITIQETMDAVTAMQEKLADVMATLARLAHAAEEAEHARAEGVDSSADERAELVRYIRSLTDEATSGGNAE